MRVLIPGTGSPLCPAAFAGSCKAPCEEGILSRSRAAFAALARMSMHVRLVPTDTGKMHGPDSMHPLAQNARRP